MHAVFQLLKKLLGKNLTKRIRPLGHGLKTWLAAAYFGFPASKLELVGITGTKGKTTTTIFTGRLMNMAGIKTGYISTAVLYTGLENRDFNPGLEVLNPFKMTSIDGFYLHRYLKEMVDNGCTHAVLEMSSQGLEQNRHIGLGKFRVTAFLNLYPEHIEAHGSFENYKACKGRLFDLQQPGGLFVGNSDDEHSQYMLDRAVKATRKNLKQYLVQTGDVVTAKQARLYLNTTEGLIETEYNAPFEVVNAAYALAITQNLVPENSDQKQILQDAGHLGSVPGRMEWVVYENSPITTTLSQAIANQPPNENEGRISILVDYAHEPESLRQLLTTLTGWRDLGRFDQIYHVLSSDGAGRDDWKKGVMGKLSADMADKVYLTTDNYDQDDRPEAILDLLAKEIDPKNQTKCQKVVDRRQCLELALSQAVKSAKSGQSVLIVSTGVGSEQGLTQPSGKLEWDERMVWKDIWQHRL